MTRKPIRSWIGQIVLMAAVLTPLATLSAALWRGKEEKYAA
jgi:hypothetical protein